jgi:predicted dehydrogenase
MQKCRLAVIGAGAITKFHIPAFQEAGFDITAICARPNSESAKSLGEQHDIENVFDDVTALLAARDKWDALLITVSTEATLDVLKLALDTGAPILVEKPVAFRSADLEPFINQNAPVLVAYNRRFYRSIREAREESRSHPNLLCQLMFPENVGTPGATADDPHYLKNFYVSVTNHGIDIARFLFGDLQIQNVNRLRSTAGALIGLTAILTAGNGHLLQFIGNFRAASNYSITMDSADRQFEIRPYEMATVYEGMDVVAPTQEVPIRRYMPKVLKTIQLDKIDFQFKPGFVEQAKTFANFIRTGDSGDAGRLEDAFAALKLAEDLTGETFPA